MQENFCYFRCIKSIFFFKNLYILIVILKCHEMVYFDEISSNWIVLAQAYIYPIFPPQAGCESMSISKRSIADLNSDFSFSSTGCPTKA